MSVIVVGSGAAGIHHGGAACGGAGTAGRSSLRRRTSSAARRRPPGGVLWIPNHGLEENAGTLREQALQYLHTLVRGPDPTRRQAGGVRRPRSCRWCSFMRSLGIAVMQAQWPDYFPDTPGARADRSIICPTSSMAASWVSTSPSCASSTPGSKLLNRYSMDLAEFFALVSRVPEAGSSPLPGFSGATGPTLRHVGLRAATGGSPPAAALMKAARSTTNRSSPATSRCAWTRGFLSEA